MLTEGRDYTYDKRRNRLYSHTALAGESDLRWFARKHTPLGLVFKKPDGLNTLVKKLDKMGVKRKQTKLNFPTTKRQRTGSYSRPPRETSKALVVRPLRVLVLLGWIKL